MPPAIPNDLYPHVHFNLAQRDIAAWFAGLASTERARVEEAAGEVVDIAERLALGGRNIVSDLFTPDTVFAEWQHYPPGDYYDRTTGAQAYYHSHDGNEEEHGHFHTFLRRKRTDGIFGLPARAIALTPPIAADGGSPDASQPDASQPNKADDEVAHVVAIRMTHHGVPSHIFTVNRWVTGETLFAAEDVIASLNHYRFEGAARSDLGRWLEAMMMMFRPQIEAALRRRDDVLTLYGAGLGEPGAAFEDRALEVTSEVPISILGQLAAFGLLDETV